MRHVLDHFTARLGAVATRLRAHRHVLVVREFLAGRRAVIVALRAALTSGRRVRTVAGAQRGCQFATLRAIDARVHGLDVVLVPLGKKIGAVLEAGITMDLTVCASLGARLEVHLVVVVLVGERGRTRGEGDKAHSGCGQRAQSFSTLHGNLP
jgi:hypothetical protein